MEEEEWKEIHRRKILDYIVGGRGFGGKEKKANANKSISDRYQFDKLQELGHFLGYLNVELMKICATSDKVDI